MKQQRKAGAVQPASPNGKPLTVVQAKVAGLDIGSRAIHVCGPVGRDGKLPIREFATTTVSILECAQWLKQLGVVSVAMESTGVYWIPVMEILEGSGLEAVLVDTRPLSRVPGRKTDVIDCQWIQTLHSYGLLPNSYRPAEPVCELRNLVRSKATLVAGQSDWIRRMQKSLDQMNVRVHHAVSDINGATGMDIIRAIVKGERDPNKLAEFRQANCQHSKEQMAEMLTGNWRPDHLFDLEHSLKMFDFHGQQIADYEAEILKRMAQMTLPKNESKTAPEPVNREKRKAIRRRNQEPLRQALFRMAGSDLTTIDGIGVETAEVILSEYGRDLSMFPTEKQFVRHLRLAPNRPVSGGKPLKKHQKNKTTRAGTALRMAATALVRSHTALGAYYRRMASAKSGAIAVFATARKLATLVYRLLRYGQAYVDEGQLAYEARYNAARIRALQANATRLGFQLVRNPASVTT